MDFKASRVFCLGIVTFLFPTSFAKSKIKTASRKPSNVLATRFTFSNLKELIEQNHLTSIDQVIPKIPANLRSNFVLMHKSRSLQKASAAYPRVILYGLDASLILSYNGNPADKGYNRIESIEFDEVQKKFSFREIEFSDKGSLRISEVNPESCLQCHESRPRPNWDSYRFWRGAYGEQDDILNSRSSKPLLSEILKFKNEISQSSPRYNSLIFRPGFWDDLDKEFPNLPAAIHRSNLRFTQLITALNGQRLAAEILHHVHYRPEYAYYLVFLNAEACRGMVIPSDAKNHLETLVKNDFGRAAATYPQNSNPPPERTSDFYAFLKNFGIETADWNTAFETSASSYSAGNSSDNPNSVIAWNLLKELMETDKRLASKVKLNEPSSNRSQEVEMQVLDRVTAKGFLEDKQGACRDLLQGFSP